MTKKRKTLFFILLLSMPSLTFASDNIPTYARQVIDAVKETAQSCGVTISVAPPNLPTPADYLATSRDGRVIAHLIDRPGVFAAKNLQGGNNHWIEYNIETIGIFTPQGTIAHANRYTYGRIWQYNYYCRSTPVNAQQFDACINQGFVQLLAQRLCNS